MSNTPLRICNKCGKEAYNEVDLELFKKNNKMKHGRMNFCKECASGYQASKEYFQQWHKDNYDSKASAKYYQDNKEHILSRNKKWRNNNKPKMAYYQSQRRALLLKATPSWASDEETKIQELYTRASEKKMHVDHIIPLNSNKVCGLHCLSNLQLLDPSVNLSKSNKLMEDFL